MDVPPLLGYKIVEGKEQQLSLRIYGGPVASFMLNEKENDLKLLKKKSYDFTTMKQD